MTTPREIEEQIQDFVDGTIDDAGRDALMDRFKTDPALLELYCSYAELESAFRRMRSSRAALGEGIADINHGAVRRMHRRSFGIAIAAAAAVITAVAVPLHLIFFRNPPPTASLLASPGSILDVSHAMTGNESPSPGNLMPGSHAKLVQGTIELNFANGVRAVVRGPADLTLHDKGRLSLQKGTAWFHVPAEAVGFKVQTPGMTVTDLGTEFGVRTRPYSLDEVHVFMGKVEVRSQHGVKATATLTTGMARAAGVVGHLSEISPDRRHFLTTLPDSLPHLHWSFDDGPQSATAGGNLPAVGSDSGRLAGLENRQAFLAAEGRFGKALATTRTIAEAKSGWTGVEGAAPRTIAHWIKLAPGGPIAQPIVGWGSHNLTPFNPNPAFLTYLRRVGGHTVAGLSFGAFHLDGTTPLDDGKWHHFAVVYHGRSLADGRPDLECYLNGEPEAMNPYPYPFAQFGSPDNPDLISIQTISSGLEAVPLTLFPRDWCGDQRAANTPLALDELYIFEAALSEAQVRNLYQKNQVQ